MNYYFSTQFLESFITFLDSWKARVMARPGFTKEEKSKMFLTVQTYEGIVTTGMYVYSSLCYIRSLIFPANHSFIWQVVFDSMLIKMGNRV